MHTVKKVFSLNIQTFLFEMFSSLFCGFLGVFLIFWTKLSSAMYLLLKSECHIPINHVELSVWFEK